MVKATLKFDKSQDILLAFRTKICHNPRPFAGRGAALRLRLIVS
jgi:hypothetical protein